jgi:hypothetical protein
MSALRLGIEIILEPGLGFRVAAIPNPSLLQETRVANVTCDSGVSQRGQRAAKHIISHYCL